MKRLLALLLCAVMLFSVLGAEAWAADGEILTVYSKSGASRRVAVGETFTYSYALKLIGAVYELDRVKFDVVYDDETLEIVQTEYPNFTGEKAVEHKNPGDLRVEKANFPNGEAFGQSILALVTVTFRAKRAGTAYVRTLPELIEVEGKNNGKIDDVYFVSNYRPDSARNALFSTYDYLGDNKPNNSTTKLNTSQDVVWLYLKDRDTSERIGAGQTFRLRGTDENGKVQNFTGTTDAYGMVAFPKVPFGDYVLTCTSTMDDGSAYSVVDPNISVPPVANGSLSLRREALVRRLQPDEMRDIVINVSWTDEYIAPGVKYDQERPKSVVLELLSGSEILASTVVTGADRRTVLERMPIYDERGDEIAYELIAGLAEHYEATVTPTDAGFDVVFSYLNDHEWDSERTEPTCEESGRVVYTCADCGKVYTYTLSALGHDYAVSGYDATCTKDGYHLYVCRRCGKWYAETTEALGHDWGEWIIDQDATETEDGLHHRFCNVCGEREDAILEGPLHDHAKHLTTVVVAPTCTEGGYTEMRCGCGNYSFVVEGSRTPALGHDYTGSSATRTVIENSCTVDGLIEYTCSRCGEMHAERVPAHGHNYGVVETREPTCTEAGYTISECAYCGDRRTMRSGALGHDWGEWIVDTPATTTSPGIKHRVCQRCLREEVGSIPMIQNGHVHHYDDERTVAPTCTEEGYTEYVCPEDGASFVDPDSKVPALGHEWEESWRTASTQKTRGVVCYKCVRCGELRYESLPKQEGGAEPVNFWDVRSGDWFYDAVRYVAYNEYMKGTSPARFEPNAPMTRAMLVTVLYRMVGSPSVQDLGMPFTDVPEDSGVWYHDPVLWAYDTGVVNGVSPTEFAPDQLITREQMVTIFWRYANYAGYDTSAAANLSVFPDAGRVSDYARAPFAWAVNAGIINGSDGYLLPQGTATRAQAAAIIQRFDAWRTK